MEPEHHDPFSEGTQRAMERLMALGVLVEAGSRVAAENARAKANREEQDLREHARRELAAREAERLARAEASRRSRDWSRFAGDHERLRGYLAGLPLQEVARHWVQAAGHADGNMTAATVLTACEDDLRRRAAGLMDFYDQYREDGFPREQAMANAARDFDREGRGPARRHGGRPPTAGAITQIGEELDHEISRLAGNLDPIASARLLHNLEDSGWSAQSLAYIEVLLDRAEVERRSAATTASTPDNPATTVDEHDAARTGAAADGRSGDHTADAAALAAQSFPVPAQQAITAHPAATPTTGPAARPTRRRAR
jgi:hypothetical protein